MADKSEYFGTEDLYEAEFDPARFLADTGEITNPREFYSQMNTLLDRGGYDALISFVGPKLAATEDSVDRIAYTTVLCEAAVERGDPEVALFHLEQIEEVVDPESGRLPLISTYTTRASIFVEKGELDQASAEMERAHDGYAKLDPETIDEEVREPAMKGLRRLILGAETKLCSELEGRGQWEALRAEAEARLVSPVSLEEETALHMALAAAELGTGDAAAAQRNLRRAERIALGNDDHGRAVHAALMEAATSLRAFGGLSARAALTRAREHLGRYIDGIDYDEQALEHLTNLYVDLSHDVRAAGV